MAGASPAPAMFLRAASRLGGVPPTPLSPCGLLLAILVEPVLAMAAGPRPERAGRRTQRPGRRSQRPDRAHVSPVVPGWARAVVRPVETRRAWVNVRAATMVVRNAVVISAGWRRAGPAHGRRTTAATPDAHADAGARGSIREQNGSPENARGHGKGSNHVFHGRKRGIIPPFYP